MFHWKFEDSCAFILQLCFWVSIVQSHDIFLFAPFMFTVLIKKLPRFYIVNLGTCMQFLVVVRETTFRLHALKRLDAEKHDYYKKKADKKR